MAWDAAREPVRATDSDESNRLSAAGRHGPYLAWRQAGTLRIHALGPHTPATIGRSDGETVLIDHPQVSREHAEVTVRVHGVPPATSVYLLDYSKHGTEHRRVRLGAHGTGPDAGPWQSAPRAPGRPHQLEDGAHDVRLAGECCVLIAGVPVDDGMTTDRDDDPVAPPTTRQRTVLVELCRPFFLAPDKLIAPPSNAQIALAAGMSEERVRNHLRDLYRRYELTGSAAPRMALVELARRHALVDATDFR